MSTTHRTALITGVSSGFELAKCFAADGHNLVLVSRSEDELNEIARSFAAQSGIRADVIAKDLFDPNAARDVYAEVQARGITVS